MSIINNEVPNNKILLKRITVDPNDKEQIENFNKNFITNHVFNQKVEIILPIKKGANEEVEEDNNNESDKKSQQKPKAKGSLLSQASSSYLLVEGEFTSLFQEQSITPLPSSSNNKSLDGINTKQLYYQIETTLDLLLSHEFIDKYIKNGGFYAISQLNFIDSGNVVAFLPNSKIILNVDKETYQELGLLGKSSVFKNLQRYIITLDMTSKEYQRGSKSYTRLIWSLKDRLSSINLICFYQKLNSTQLQSIDFPQGVKVLPSYNQPTQEILNLRLPTLNIINENLNINNSNNDIKMIYNDFINEWVEVLGFASLGINLNQVKDFEIGNSLLSQCPIATKCLKATQKGLVSNSFILELIEKIKLMLSKGLIEYGVLNIYGFADTPISWNSIEHNFLYGGENDQSLLILPNNKFISSNLIGTYDYYC
ncbi:RNase P protein subunit [Dictyostelium discoideum AX4]|uniref:RNase P protein subunit n=1 Tax=Dictyostelium discoideum TaxID=44689 RepID=Q54W23_DICDI|nr:RNase P protein subunit [Dictyostelium discoideum AX4]ABB95687.2 RNase P protein subunit DRpp40 [Dictyostelium discoideum]EAL67452.1 RNase P protein subunit [Dictyostelium discoideum AX4]|eukprot:XP_641427.1 RNase P protein subunit [Dictyostelium discoideum AX4]